MGNKHQNTPKSYPQLTLASENHNSKTAPNYQKAISFSIYKNLVQFLQIHDILTLSLTCKRFLHFMNQNQPIFGIAIYNDFLSDQLEFNLQILYSEEFIQFRNLKNFEVLEFSQNTKWKQLLLQLNKQKKQFTYYNTLRGNFLEFFTSTQCPKPILKRETQGVYAETEYQSMLSQRLELEQKGFNKLFDTQINSFNVKIIDLITSKQLMKQIKQNKEILIQSLSEEIVNRKDMSDLFLKIRWSLEEEIETLNTPQSYLLTLLQEFINVSNIYCTTLCNYLQTFLEVKIEAFHLISEYVLYWQAFNNSLLEMQQTMINFEMIINEAYQLMFPNHPQFPKFSIWRCLIKKWINQVYSQMYQILEECYIKILKFRRNQLLSSEFEEKVNSQKSLNLCKVSHELYDNFVQRKKLSVYLGYQLEIEIENNYFQDQTNEIDELLLNFFKSIQDISLNDVNIHWYGHSSCKFEYPFENLQERILEESMKFYQQQESLFEDNISNFIQFLSKDLDFIGSVTYEPLVNSLRKIQKEQLNSFISAYLKQDPLFQSDTSLQLSEDMTQSQQILMEGLSEPPCLMKQIDKIPSMHSSSNDHLDTQGDEASKIFQFILENPSFDVNEAMAHQQLKDYSDPVEDLIQRSLQKLQIDDRKSQDEMYFSKKESISISHKCENVKEILQEFQNFNQNFKKNRLIHLMRDRDIDLWNEDHQIPKTLQPSEQLFYEVNKNITLDILLQNVHEIDEQVQKRFLLLIKDYEESLEKMEEYNSDQELPE